MGLVYADETVSEIQHVKKLLRLGKDSDGLLGRSGSVEPSHFPREDFMLVVHACVREDGKMLLSTSEK